MKNSVIFGILAVVLVLVIAGFLVANSLNADKSSTVGTGSAISDNSLDGSSDESVTGPQTYTVEITSSGFSPKELTIKNGDTVTWVNKDSKGHWPASAMHPTHTVYPGSNIEKCSTADEPNLFDSCRDIPAGESWSFTFNEAGSWGYHDHSHTGLYGKIIVQ